MDVSVRQNNKSIKENSADTGLSYADNTYNKFCVYDYKSVVDSLRLEYNVPVLTFENKKTNTYTTLLLDSFSMYCDGGSTRLAANASAAVAVSVFSMFML
tara:strand:+ start:346 stop:645 length:300 start_codon:yes stop_codon:yes gene_type:complete